MDRAYLSNTSGTPPLPPAVPAIGFPQAGNPATSQKATRPGMYWYYMITESLRNIVVAAGLEPDHENLGQVVEALGKMFLGRGVGDWLRDSGELERFNFQAGGTTSYKGHGAVAHSFLNDAGVAIARMLKNGNMTLPGLALAADDNSESVPTTAWVQTLFGASASEIGKISFVPAMQASANHAPAFGVEVSRTGAYAQLWAFAQASGALVTDAVFASRPGCFSYGPGGVGGSTFRVPKIPGLVIKAYHNGDGTYTTNTTALMGQYLADEVKSHNHETLTGTSEGDSWNTYTNGNGPNGTNVPTTYTGGAENTVRSVVLFPQIRYR